MEGRMKKTDRKKLCRIGLCITLLAIGCSGALSGCGALPQSDTVKEMPENPGIRVTFFDVGKGDAVLIETENHCMLIDSGYDDTAGVILGYLEREDIDRLDYMLITHFDKDHVGGADRVLEAVEVGEVLQPDYEFEAKQYREYMETMEAGKMRPRLVTETLRLSLDEAELLVYPPQHRDYEEEDNDFSLVVSMRYGEKSFLFAGDSERERLEELLGQQEFPLAHDILKVPHHGRAEKNSEEFFQAVMPETAVITCSKDKLPDREVLLLLERLGTKIYLTTEGSLTFFCNGKELEILQQQ